MRVLVLGGGPDAEREVSLASAQAIHQACVEAGYDSNLLTIDLPTQEEVNQWDADVIFPALHGRFGEGGSLQALLQQAGKTFVGSKKYAAKLAMDKLGTKLVAARCSIPTPAACMLDPRDIDSPSEAVCPYEFPVVVKPVAEGSSVGLHMCHHHAQWVETLEHIGNASSNHQTVYMIERFLSGREITVSVIADSNGELMGLPLIEIQPAHGSYDYEAKYKRDDTQYTCHPEFESDASGELVATLKEQAVTLCEVMGVEHLARVDFMVHDSEHWGVLEVNTMPGFTETSLLPMAAKAHGYSLSELCKHLVGCAIGRQELCSK